MQKITIIVPSVTATGIGETPSSVPLPPPTPSEDAALNTPKRPHVTSAPLYSASTPITSTHLSTSPHTSMANTSSSANASADDFYKTQRRSTLESTESSSSTSLEVSEILEAARQPDGDEETEDENVAASRADDDDVMETQSSQMMDLPEQQVPQKSPYKSSIWPQPPDLGEVNMEAERLASNAIQRAAELHSHHR